MIYTNTPGNCLVFVLPRRLTQSAIYGSQTFDFHKWPTVLVRVENENRAIWSNTCVDHYILLLKAVDTIGKSSK